ncbi:MAG: HAD family hydrolase [Clostridia bacterium]|nr:HAD family hydrolase [Clostridia bacterium]
MAKGIIFDLDGTLLNTIGDIHKVLNECLTAFGLENISVEKCTRLVGHGAKRLVQDAVDGEIWEEVYKLYAKKFSECENESTTLYEGEEDVLSELQNRGVKFAVVTNKPQRATENVCRKLLSNYHFCALFGQSGEYPLKPDPTATLKATEIMGLQKQDCIFIGDGETDVLTAKNAGLDCVSVLWGYRTKTQLQTAGALSFANTFPDILKFV